MFRYSLLTQLRASKLLFIVVALPRKPLVTQGVIVQ